MGHAKIISRPTPMLRKQMGQIAKLFGLWDNSRLKDPVQRRANPQPVMRDGAPDFLSQTRGVHSRHVTRRQIVLNRHFTEIVSDVLAIEFSKEIHDRGIKITSIETKAWNKGVRIFYTKDGFYDESLHKKLIELEPKIRYAVSERRIIARAPQINFVYDNSIEFDNSLEKVLSEVSLEDDDESKQTALTKSSTAQLYVTKNLGMLEEKLVSKKFIAPPDMDNTMFGLNYPELYDEVASALSRGRGESSRMAANATYLTFPKPLFRDTQRGNTMDEDPVTRIKSMQKFMISQKLKAENKARFRRREELLSLNRYKWVKTESDLGDDEKIAPDISEPNNIVDDLASK